MATTRSRDRKRVREANGASLGVLGDGVVDEHDVDYIDVEMDALDDDVGSGSMHQHHNASQHQAHAQAQHPHPQAYAHRNAPRQRITRVLAHVPFYPHLGSDDFDDRYVPAQRICGGLTD